MGWDGTTIVFGCPFCVFFNAIKKAFRENIFRVILESINLLNCIYLMAQNGCCGSLAGHLAIWGFSGKIKIDSFERLEFRGMSFCI